MQKGAERLKTNVDCVNELTGLSDICTPGALSESTLCYLPPHCHFSSFIHWRAVQQVRGEGRGVCWVDRPKGQTGGGGG